MTTFTKIQYAITALVLAGGIVYAVIANNSSKVKPLSARDTTEENQINALRTQQATEIEALRQAAIAEQKKKTDTLHTGNKKSAASPSEQKTELDRLRAVAGR